ncbi:MAG: hypothetical protein GY755_11180 [Chloroflexi bacterium]|nr:hypothetical protein [Chloroflexota bacterium]
MNKKLAIGIGIGCVVACVVVGIIFLGAGGLLVKWALEEPENISIEVLTPAMVSNGEDYIIDVQITNTADEAQDLNSIDIDKSYLSGIVIRKTEPAYIDIAEHEFLGAVFTSYYFDSKVPASGTENVKFYVTALKPGDFTGEIDVCINSVSDCLEQYLRTVVKE